MRSLAASRPAPGVRAELWADEDLPDDGPPPAAVVHLAAAIGLGPEEVGADALAEALAAMGGFGLTVEDWARPSSVRRPQWTGARSATWPFRWSRSGRRAGKS
ncbi:hypothetical protein LJ221_21120 [Streptomyces sp. CNQ085]|nr:hypothetical protein [Streptomyces sp. CNQ085]